MAQTSMQNATNTPTNALIDETSPYLLQHAHNPVNWYPWGQPALQKAKDENKLILISIGYAACHWCHVMEKESFEDAAIAQVMNDHFVCIKVDREERPDVDQVYMDALQLMTGQGGWPLNCVALPDGRPIWGGTYFPKAKWRNVLLQIADFYKTSPQKAAEYASKLASGMAYQQLQFQANQSVSYDTTLLQQMIKKWQQSFDVIEGGQNRAPKFPMPTNYLFLLRYGILANDQKVTDHVQLTLKKMAYGGIYDQIGGGFARYATDAAWKIPHFEKMLYDNAQLVSLYSEAYRAFKDTLYQKIVEETLQFVERELMDSSGLFYASLDADSEGEEGKFYVWQKSELQEVLGDDFTLAEAYFNINHYGLWEQDNYILLRKQDNDKIAQQFNMRESDVIEKINIINRKLMARRAERVRPGLDDKCLTSWNALMIMGYLDAYQAFTNENYLIKAKQSLSKLFELLYQKNGALHRNYKAGRSTIPGFLEDYAFVIAACIKMYEATFELEWVDSAMQLLAYTTSHFYDERLGLFYFTSDEDDPLVLRKIEVTDHVIPAANSSLAGSIYWLGRFFGDASKMALADQMLANLHDYLQNYGPSASNWAQLLLQKLYPNFEVAIVGEQALEKRVEFRKHYLPQCMVVGSKKSSELPLFKNRYDAWATRIYVCQEGSCKLPVNEVVEAVKLID